MPVPDIDDPGGPEDPEGAEEVVVARDTARGIGPAVAAGLANPAWKRRHWDTHYDTRPDAHPVEVVTSRGEYERRRAAGAPTIAEHVDATMPDTWRHATDEQRREWFWRGLLDTLGDAFVEAAGTHADVSRGDMVDDTFVRTLTFDRGSIGGEWYDLTVRMELTPRPGVSPT